MTYLSELKSAQLIMLYQATKQTNTVIGPNQPHRTTNRAAQRVEMELSPSRANPVGVTSLHLNRQCVTYTTHHFFLEFSDLALAVKPPERIPDFLKAERT